MNNYVINNNLIIFPLIIILKNYCEGLIHAIAYIVLQSNSHDVEQIYRKKFEVLSKFILCALSICILFLNI